MHRGASFSLRNWARSEGLSEATAYRRFHAGALTDAGGRPMHAEQDPVTRGIRVYPEVLLPLPDPLADVDAHALVALLEEAGYVVLTADEAAGFGVDRRTTLVAAS